MFLTWELQTTIWNWLGHEQLTQMNFEKIVEF